MFQLAFYRAEHGGMLDKLIDAASGRGGFSHVELRFSDGMFFSSSGMDGGVRYKQIDPVIGHWQMIDIPGITREDEVVLRRWCDAQVGKKYDYRGVIGFVAKVKDQHARWFCSEIVIAALQQIAFLHYVPPWQVSPNALRLIVLSDVDLGKPKLGWTCDQTCSIWREKGEL